MIENNDWPHFKVPAAETMKLCFFWKSLHNNSNAGLLPLWFFLFYSLLITNTMCESLTLRTRGSSICQV